MRTKTDGQSSNSDISSAGGRGTGAEGRGMRPASFKTSQSFLEKRHRLLGTVPQLWPLQIEESVHPGFILRVYGRSWKAQE